MEVQDFSQFHEGDEGPVGEGKIKLIILKDVTHIVFLNEKDEIFWSTNGKYGEWKKGYGLILNQVSILESQVESLLKGKELHNYKCMIGEGVARLIDERDIDAAQRILDSVQEKINLLGKEVLRVDYLTSSFITTVSAIIILIVIWQFRISLIEYIGETVFYGALCSLAGAIGAFISTFIRSNSYDANIEISVRIHRLDGFLRVFYGLIAGFMVYIGIKANLIFGFVNPSQSHCVIFFLCAIGGASEVVLPSLIKQTETDVHKGKY